MIFLLVIAHWSLAIPVPLRDFEALRRRNLDVAIFRESVFDVGPCAEREHGAFQGVME
jgi:hypothetical protein